jgi:hypothetical protein
MERTEVLVMLEPVVKRMLSENCWKWIDGGGSRWRRKLTEE